MTIKSDIVLQLARGFWNIGFVLHFIAALRVAFNRDRRYLEDHIIIQRKYRSPTIPENDTNFVSIVHRLCGEMIFNFCMIFKVFGMGFAILYLIFK